MKQVLFAAVLSAVMAAGAAENAITNASLRCTRYEPGTEFRYDCWKPDAPAGAELGVYMMLEYGLSRSIEALGPLMAKGEIPWGIVIGMGAGRDWNPEGTAHCGMRCEEFDQVGTEFPNAIIEEIIPDAARRLGVKVTDKADCHFITGGSSGGLASWNACWFRNDYFRRAFLSSPTFSAMRGGNTLMPLIRKCEARPIRVWMTVGTDEPDYFFGDSYHVAMDALSAMRFAGYEIRFERIEGGGHCAKYWDREYFQKAMRWIFEDWKTKPVTTVTHPIRVRDLIVKGTSWKESPHVMKAPVRTVIDGWIEYSVSPENRFISAKHLAKDGTRTPAPNHAPLELAWNVSEPGGKAIALMPCGRVLVATGLGVQSAIKWGMVDAILPLPGDVPCDNVELEGHTLYASSCGRVWERPLNPDATSPGYSDDFWYGRHHSPAGSMAELLGSYVTAGRIAGVVSVLSDHDYKVQMDCAGWAKRGVGREARRMSGDTLFAIFSMTKTFTGIAAMCAIDDGLFTLDDRISKFLPEFAEVKFADGRKPKREHVVRDFICHADGMREEYPSIDNDLPLREAAKWYASKPIREEPGETFRYGTMRFSVIAAAIEVAAGEKFEDYLRRKVLDPLGMKDTTWRPDGEQVKRLACAYNSDDTRLRPAADRCAKQLVFPKPKRIEPAAGAGLFSTPNDMIRFSQMLAHHGEWKGKRIVSRETFDKVFSRIQVPQKLAAERPYTTGAWIYGDWIGHEGAMRTDQRANLKTGHSRVFFIQTENAAGSAFFQLKRDWHFEADKLQGTESVRFGN